jgi:transcriptional regulator with XRE-family HTH domain
MAYRKIPRKFNLPEIAADLQNQLLYAEDSDPSAIKQIADIMGMEKRTVYSILSGKIKISLDFLHAATIATNGYPEVSKYLEPNGFCLKKIKSDIESDKGTVDGEAVDVTMALTKLVKTARDALVDDTLTTAERVRIKDAARVIKDEVDQLLNVVGIKGGV